MRRLASYYVSGMKTSQFMCHLLFPGEDDHTSLVLSGSTIPLPNVTLKLQLSRQKFNDAIAWFEQIVNPHESQTINKRSFSNHNECTF